MTNGYVHNDEKHEYFDPIKKEFVTKSGAHAHAGHCMDGRLRNQWEEFHDQGANH